MSNFSAKTFLWIILQSLFIENVWNYYFKRNVLDWRSIIKIDTFEIFNSWNILYLFLYIQLAFQFSAY